MDDTLLRSAELLSRHNSRLVVVDVQGKLVGRIHRSSQVVGVCRRLIQGAQILGVPVFATEQYPQGLGETVPELAELLPARLTKVRFSSAEALGWGTAAEQGDDRYQVVVCGIEAHVCILQTVLDLIARGFQVSVPADGVGSRHEMDWKFALDRMSTAGATIVTSESVLFEWCEVAGTPEFKQISQLIKEADVSRE